MKVLKNIITACSAFVIIISAVPVLTNAQVAYDVNMDSKADVNDVTALQKYLVGFGVSIDKSQADVNNDGVLDIRDATALQVVLEKITSTETSTEIPKETEDIGDLIF